LLFQGQEGQDDFELYSSTALNNVLLVNGKECKPGSKPKVGGNMLGYLIRIKLTGHGVPIGKRAAPKQFDVLIDRAESLPDVDRKKILDAGAELPKK
jgi:hypothetical protein